jgi:hypothetical protein
MSRPEPLFPLFAELETLDGVGPKTATAFAALTIERPKDLLFLLPHSGIDRARKNSVRDVVPPTTITVEVTVGGHFPPRAKGRPYRVMVRDASFEFQLVFFHARADYLTKLLPTGQKRLISGRVEIFDAPGRGVRATPFRTRLPCNRWHHAKDHPPRRHLCHCPRTCLGRVDRRPAKGPRRLARLAGSRANRPRAHHQYRYCRYRPRPPTPCL